MVMHTTAMGRKLDMAAMRQKNKHVRAVGNMNVDAAGNVLDSNNQVIEDGSRRVNRVYNRAAQNPSAQARAAAAQAPARPVVAPAADSQPVAKAVQSARAPVPPAPTVPEILPPPVAQPAPVDDDEVSEIEYIDLSEYDIEEPVGKEQPKIK